MKKEGREYIGAIAGIMRPKIKRVKIKECGVIKYAEMCFKDGLNVIIGKNATGKTTAINAIMASFLRKEIYGKGKVEIEFFSNNGAKNGEAVLIDDALARLDKGYRKKALEFFRKSKNQFIITHNGEMPSGLKANIIDTKDFILKTEEK